MKIVNLKFISIFIVALLPLSSFAAFQIKIPVPVELRFSNAENVSETDLPDITEEPETPTEPGFDFSEFKGVGIIDFIDSAGYIDTTNIQSMWIERALLKQYNSHLIYLLGNQQELMDNASIIELNINGDILPCVIDYKKYVAVFNKTIFGCATAGYSGFNYSAGQQFSIDFK